MSFVDDFELILNLLRMILTLFGSFVVDEFLALTPIFLDSILCYLLDWSRDVVDF